MTSIIGVKGNSADLERGGLYFTGMCVQSLKVIERSEDVIPACTPMTETKLPSLNIGLLVHTILRPATLSNRTSETPESQVDECCEERALERISNWSGAKQYDISLVFVWLMYKITP